MNYLDRHFNHVRIVTKERTFTYANTNLTEALGDVRRYYDDAEIISIYAGDVSFHSISQPESNT